MSKKQERKPYKFQLGQIDRGVLLSILVMSLALVSTTAISTFQTSPMATGADFSPGATNTGVAAVPAVGIFVVFFSNCFEIVLILIVLTIISYIVWKLLEWVETFCSGCCSCSWRKPWCCLCSVVCWAVTFTKWVAQVVTVILAISVPVAFIVCIVMIIAAL